MDETSNHIADRTTRQIVASNLTAAYCANHKEQLTEQDVLDVYQHFLDYLKPPSEGSFKQIPGRPF